MLKVTNETGYCFVNIHQSIHSKVILTTETGLDFSVVVIPGIGGWAPVLIFDVVYFDTWSMAISGTD